MYGCESQEKEHQGCKLVEVVGDVTAAIHNFFLERPMSAPGQKPSFYLKPGGWLETASTSRSHLINDPCFRRLPIHHNWSYVLPRFRLTRAAP